jgi:hypothetical protein
MYYVQLPKLLFGDLVLVQLTPFYLRNHLQPGALLAAPKPRWWNLIRNQGFANRNKPVQLRQAKQDQRNNMQRFRYVATKKSNICRKIFLYRYVTRVQVTLKQLKNAKKGARAHSRGDAGRARPPFVGGNYEKIRTTLKPILGLKIYSQLVKS